MESAEAAADAPSRDGMSQSGDIGGPVAVKNVDLAPDVSRLGPWRSDPGLERDDWSEPHRLDGGRRKMA
jgi:hypothetical protein